MKKNSFKNVTGPNVLSTPLNSGWQSADGSDTPVQTMSAATAAPAAAATPAPCNGLDCGGKYASTRAFTFILGTVAGAAFAWYLIKKA